MKDSVWREIATVIIPITVGICFFGYMKLKDNGLLIKERMLDKGYVECIDTSLTDVVSGWTKGECR